MRSKLTHVYLMHSITGLASSLIGIFVPAYLITRGYSLAYVFGYSLVFSVATLIFFVIAASGARRIGVRAIVIASFPFTLGEIALLYLLPHFAFPVLSIAFIQGIGSGLYWFSLHMFFSANAEEEKMGDSVGKLYSFPQIAGLLAPLVGGLIAAHFGFSALFLAAGVVFAFSLIPLLSIPDLVPDADFSFSHLAGLFKQFKRYSVVEFFENIREELEAVIWPLFVFLAFRSALSVGIVGTVAGVGSILFTLIVGRYTDRAGVRFFMRIGAILMAALWLARYFAPPSQILFYAITLAVGFFACLIEVPLMSYVYASAKHERGGSFLVYRELPVTLARIVLYGVAILLAQTKLLFLVGAAASALILLF